MDVLSTLSTLKFIVDRDDVSFEMIHSLVDEDTELISVYYGADISEEDAGSFRKRLEEAFENIDVEVQYGGQPIYYYIVSVE